MKSYSQIVNKHFKVNKRRNISTIIGIVVSIILFVVVGYLSNYMGEVDIASVISKTGNYEAIIKDLDRDEIDKVIYNVNVESYGLYNLEYEKDISTGVVNRSFEIYALDKNSINNIFKPLFKLKEGNLPTKSGELALTYSAKEYFGKNIGDILEYNNKVYNIVGFYEDDVERITGSLSGTTFLDISGVKSNLNLSIHIKDKVNKINEIENILKVLNIDDKEKVIINKRLFFVYGIHSEKYGVMASNNTVAIAIINVVILLLTSLFTYGSINVALKERIRDFAALRCIGATPSKIRYLLIKESFILGILTIVPGIVLGQILSWIISVGVFTKIIGINNYGLGLKLYPGVILTSIMFTALTITLATIIPILKASKISPIQGAKSEIKEDIKIKRRNSKLINKILGYKGNLAYKNIVANNKSFIVITLSLTSLLVVFITFSWYYSFLLNEYNRGKENGFDIAADFDTYTIAEKEEINAVDLLSMANALEEEFKGLGVTKNMLNYSTIRQNVEIKGMEINSKLSDTSPIREDLYQNDGNLKATAANFLIYDDVALNKIIPYINSWTEGKKVTIADFNNDGFIILKTAYGQRVSPIVPLGDETIQLYLDEEKDNPINANYLGSIEHKQIISANRYGYYNDLTIIVSEEFISKNSDFIQKVNTFASSVKINMNIDDNVDKIKAKSELQRVVLLKNGYFFEEKARLEDEKNFYDAMAVMLYTTLILAIVIGAINIINTRSVNIMLRKKEFGTMLAVGMSNEGLKKLIMLEGIVQWFISATFGTFLSIIIIKIFNIIFIFSADAAMYPIQYGTILIGLVILLTINLLSSLLPYKRFNKVEVTELLRNEE